MSRHYCIRAAVAALASAPLLAAALLPSPARAGPALAVDPPRARPGDAVLVTVRGAAEAPRGTLAGRELRFWAVEGGWQAVGALPLEQAPGAAEVEVRAPAELSARLEVVEPGFPETQLKVEPKYVTPSPAQQKRMEEDQAAFDAAWRQPFGAPAFEAAFAPPRTSAVTGPFGERRLFNGKKQSQHRGTDLAGAVGEPVAASNDGVVVLARDCYASGKSLVLWHGADLFSVYFHLDAFDAKVGDRVRRGQVVARVGMTGRVTGPHLHFGVKVGDRYVDPASVYRLSFGPPRAPRRGRRAGCAGAPGSRRRWCRPTGSRRPR
jgi:murein DD-endopeptidase MepM/ murein hydrolase activator NlpD